MQQETSRKKTILVVDDEPRLVLMIQRTLLDEGYEVFTAGDGELALSLVKEHNPDLILLDIMMPGHDGIFTLERIREISSAPVIMITGARDEKLLERTLDSGADDFLRKPFRTNELIARIQAKFRRL